ncbi:MAG: helix-turn-helix transcriptional regulator, partial [Adlercreutzia sp.]|nr:helix-turn-helix transcriptional regulator [Adlercreutzia sp.]
VFELLMVGHNATSVASELTISYHTARSHVRNIYAKLNVHSRTELLEALKEFSEQYDARQQNT